MQKHSTEFEALRRAGFQRWANKLREQQSERFWNRVIKGDKSQCWPFTGSVSGGKFKYGRVSFNGKIINAHQVAYILTHGDYDRSLDVCHTCDNPICCNPNHLWIGTTTDNMRDMYAKGRHKREGIKGEANATALLTNNQVIEMRKHHGEGMSQRQIAKMFGVDYRTVNVIVLRKAWKHI